MIITWQNSGRTQSMLLSEKNIQRAELVKKDTESGSGENYTES
tara:strand:- start:474 stop:602 length:129 start_codon:yes stop_codon:yes gene_type:complete